MKYCRFLVLSVFVATQSQAFSPLESDSNVLDAQGVAGQENPAKQGAYSDGKNIHKICGLSPELTLQVSITSC